MRRRILSLLLAFAMVLGMMPVTAMAEETTSFTVTAGEVAYEASYVGTGGAESLGQEGGVYAVQIPEAMAISVEKEAAEPGSYTAADVSGSVLVSFQEYPLELTEEVLSECILTDAEKESCSDLGIDLSMGTWAGIILSDGEVQQYLFILLGDAGVMAADAVEIPVADNVIDITDKTVATRNDIYNAKAVNITVSGANVVSATENGTTVNILLHGTTAPDATVTVKFGTKLDSSCSMTGTEGSVTLTDGSASLSMTLSGKAVNKTGTATYTLNFSLDEPPTEVPTRLVESDSMEAYTGIAKEISLEGYYGNAVNYYLVEGENLTELEDAAYTFTPAEDGIHTLIFTASNQNGTSPDYVTVTVTATEIQSGTWIGYETSSGSMDYVLFTDSNGETIEGILVSVADKTIQAILPQTFALNGSIKAAFGMTQNNGLPFLTTKTGTSGTSSNKAVNNKFTEKTIALSDGEAAFTFYYYNTTPSIMSNNYETWKIDCKIFNNIPTLKEGAASTDAQTITAMDDTYMVNLSDLFTDADGQDLTYKVSINGGEYTTCDANYSFNTGVAGTYELVFKANDGSDDSADTYTVTLTVENSSTTYPVAVAVAETVEGLSFHADSLSGEKLTYADGSVQVPQNVTSLWWKTADGMSGTTAVSNGTALNLQLVTFVVKTALGDVDGDAVMTVTDPAGKVATGNGLVYLLKSGTGYTFKAIPSSSYSGSWNAGTLNNQTITTDSTATVTVELTLKNAKTITVDKGAEVKVYYQPQYFVLNEVQPVLTTDNGDTVTYTYACPNKTENSMGYLYFAKKDGLIDKAGYLHDVTDATITWKGDSRTASYRTDYDRSTIFGSRGDDSVFVNVNNKGHLVLNEGDTFRLRALRIWEIIDHDSGNVMIEPDYIYTRYGSDIFSLDQVTDKIPGSSGNNWVDMTATGSGVAFLEVGYEAVHIVDGLAATEDGGSYGQPGNYTYNASDPARTALVVVQTDGNAASDVTFGIKNNNGGTWDAEFDTLYFTGDRGKITFIPSAASGIGSVAVSNNKGQDWATLTADDSGAYTADIVSGANVIRVINTNGQTAYQVVRGDKVTYTITNITSGKESTTAIEPGDTVRVTFDGMHAPAGKISGIYNAKAHQLTYLWNGERVTQSDFSGYNLPANSKIEVTIPTGIVEDYTLTGGYISFSSYGDFFGNHRKLADAGISQNTNADTRYGKLSSLPDVKIPVVLPTCTVTLTEGEGYTIAACEGSTSPVTAGGSFSFTVTVNDGYQGTPVVKVGDTELTAENGVYTIENIAADQTVTVDGITKIVTYTVTLTEGEGYTIAACEGSTSPVTASGSFSFTVTVNDGYQGTPVVKVGDTELTAENGVYTIENITANQVVTVGGIEKTAFSPGHLDDDDRITATDAAMVYAIVKGNLQDITEDQRKAADVDGEPGITATDAALIYAYVKGKITTFPVAD